MNTAWLKVSKARMRGAIVQIQRAIILSSLNNERSEAAKSTKTIPATPHYFYFNQHHTHTHTQTMLPTRQHSAHRDRKTTKPCFHPSCFFILFLFFLLLYSCLLLSSRKAAILSNFFLCSSYPMVFPLWSLWGDL